MQLLERIINEWKSVKQFPLILIFSAILIAGTEWAIMAWAYSNSFANKDSQIALLQEQLSAKEKTNAPQPIITALPSSESLDVGNGSVVAGNVRGKVGENSVVIGPTDSRGNTIFTNPGAYGAGAVAGPGSIAVGRGARAGVAPTNTPPKQD